jgi:3-deoxy-D-arabino-heptulosonate 7-phosphate (DAHP) synthase
MVQSKTYILTERYFNHIKKGRLTRYDMDISELECHKCRTPIPIGSDVVTKITHSRTKRSYYHPACARLVNIL